jgi:hypothetical protein
MPYYVYKITEPMLLEYLNQTPNFKEAKQMVTGLRQQLAVNEDTKIRMIFAHSTGEAEQLLSVPKNHQIIGED